MEAGRWIIAEKVVQKGAKLSVMWGGMLSEANFLDYWRREHVFANMAASEYLRGHATLLLNVDLHANCQVAFPHNPEDDPPEGDVCQCEA